MFLYRVEDLRDDVFIVVKLKCDEEKPVQNSKLNFISVLFSQCLDIQTSLFFKCHECIHGGAHENNIPILASIGNHSEKFSYL